MEAAQAKGRASGAGMVLATLCAGQFLMMLDTVVWNGDCWRCSRETAKGAADACHFR